jgi:hypothetical protein
MTSQAEEGRVKLGLSEKRKVGILILNIDMKYLYSKYLILANININNCFGWTVV